MHAAYYDAIGPAEQVLRLGELPEPRPGPGEVRVRLRWSGINPSDVKTRGGLRGARMPFARVVPHSDGMGVIDAVGPGVAAARIGQRVWTWNAARGRPGGTAAQWVALPAAQAVPLPDATPDEAGACLGVPALTALHAVLTDGGVQGQRVLVAGGAGAVGHCAVQCARSLGARQVVATASSPAKAALARAAGAEATVDYRAADAVAQLREATQGEGFDRVIEVDLAANLALDLAVMRPGGLWVVYGTGPAQVSMPVTTLMAREALLRFFIVYDLRPAERARAHAALDELLRRGALSPRIGLRLALDEIVQAHRAVEGGGVVGNVVLAID